MNKFNSSLRPISGRNQRRLGRRMKDESGLHGAPAGFQPAAPAPTPTASPDNAGGNAGGAGNDSGGTNNAVQPLDPDAFWNPAPAGESGGTGSSAGSESPPTQAPDMAAVGQQIQQVMTGAQFAPIMTPEIAAAMGQGDFTGFQANMEAHTQNVMKTTIQAMVPLLRAFQADLEGKFTTQVKSEFGTRETQAAVEAAIPEAKHPATRPIVNQIFTQAMKVTKGDQKAAIEMTKSMLTLQAETLAPKSTGDSAAPVTNWLEELTSR